MVRIFKFGGASLKNAAAIRNTADIIRQHAAGNQLLIVVSAMGQTTNRLEALYSAYAQPQAGVDHPQEILQEIRQYHEDIARELFGELPETLVALFDNLFGKLETKASSLPHSVPFDEGYDQVLCYGEIISSHLVARYLQHLELPVEWIDSRRYIQTDMTWREARIDWLWTESQVQRQLAPKLKQQIALTQGFIGGTVDGRTTTLGREGSDFTAAIYAHCLRAASVTIWKDVPGILNADPKRIADTYLYPNLSYEEAAEMTYYGATVIHPKTIRPLKSRNIPLYVRSFLNPDAPGTCIGEGQPEGMRPAIIFKRNQRMISFSGRDLTFVSEHNHFVILNACARQNLHINLMQNSAISFLICCDYNPWKVQELVDSLREQFEIKVSDDLELITIKHYDLPTIEKVMKGKKALVEQNTLHTYQAVVPTSAEPLQDSVVPLFEWKPIG